MTNTTTATDITTDAGRDAVVVAYRAADVSGKSYMRAYAASARDAAIVAGDVVAAVAVIDTMTAMMAPVTRTVAVDYATTVANRRASLVAAIAAIDAGDLVMPSGVSVPVMTDDDFAGGVPVASDVTRFVTVSGRKSGRGDIPAYVSDALSAMASDVTTARVSDIRKFGNDDYAAGAASAGAVAAYFDRCIAGTDAAPDGWVIGTDAHGTKSANRA